MQKNQHPHIMHWGCNNKIQSQFYTFDHMIRLGFRKRLRSICIWYNLCVHSNFRTNHHHSWWLGTTYKIWFPNQLDMPSKILPRKAQVCHLVSRRKSKYIELKYHTIKVSLIKKTNWYYRPRERVNILAKQTKVQNTYLWYLRYDIHSSWSFEKVLRLQ